MTLRRHDDPDRFLAAAEPLLARGPATRAIYTALAGGFRASPVIAGEPWYLATWDDGRAFGAACQRGEGGLILEESDAVAAAAFAADLAAQQPRLPAVVGALAACEAFAREWQPRTGRAHALRFHLRHHVLQALVEPPPAPGRTRIAGADDQALVAELSLEFMREAGLPDADQYVRRVVPRRLARGLFRLREAPEAVALAAWDGAGDDAARITLVYTRPAARGKGQAAALVADVVRELRAAGRPHVYLTTDVSNPTPNRLYARLGFAPAHDLYHFDLVDVGGDR